MNREALVVIGSIGSAGYLLWLTSAIFWESWAFPFILTAVGLFVIYVGVMVQKYLKQSTLLCY